MDPLNSEIPDEQIVLAIQKGDKEQFGVLMERYEKKILRYGKKFLSDHADVLDITQDVFINAYRNLQSFDQSQKFSPWIYRIAHNAFVNAIKKNIFRPSTLFDFDTLVSHVTYDDPAVKEREQKEMHEMIEKGLDKISPKYKEVLILYFQEELGYKEISEVLEIPTSTVGIRIARAKEALRKVYKEMHIDHGTYE